MTRCKGESRKQAATPDHLAAIVDGFQRLQRISASLITRPEQLPRLAASATLKAGWAELSGSTPSGAWSFPAGAVPLDGVSPLARGVRGIEGVGSE